MKFIVVTFLSVMVGLSLGQVLFSEERLIPGILFLWNLYLLNRFLRMPR